MKVFELRVKVYLLRDIQLKNLRDKLQKFIDKSLSMTEDTLEYHNESRYKEYSFGSLLPIVRSGIYSEGKVYTFTVRTSSEELAYYFADSFSEVGTNEFKCMRCGIKVIENRQIESIYSLSPVVIKNDDGYWRGSMSVYAYITRIGNNLFKKYKSITDENIEENFNAFSDFKFINRMPIGCLYKSATLLGDKVEIEFGGDEESQKLAYTAIANGLGEMNARGFGFVGYRYKEDI